MLAICVLGNEEAPPGALRLTRKREGQRIGGALVNRGSGRRGSRRRRWIRFHAGGRSEGHRRPTRRSSTESGRCGGPRQKGMSLSICGGGAAGGATVPLLGGATGAA